MINIHSLNCFDLIKLTNLLEIYVAKIVTTVILCQVSFKVHIWETKERS